jgi:5'-3' exonuclease
VGLFLVDGTYELFRCFHGAPRAAGPTGEEVGAGRAAFATFAALLADPAVSHVAVTFDSLLAPPDKRADPLAAQVPLVVDVVRALGMVVWPSGRFSADELLASGARRFRDGAQVTLCTTDLDNAQCVRGDRVVLLDRSRRKVTTEGDVRERFGVGPEQLPDLFALAGDRSDGIAGVPGWGLRSAAAIVAAHGRLEDVPADPARWGAAIRGAARLAATLAERRQEALHARDLLVLRDDAPIPYDLTDLEWRGADRAAVAAIVARLGAPELGERVTRFA